MNEVAKHLLSLEKAIKKIIAFSTYTDLNGLLESLTLMKIDLILGPSNVCNSISSV